MTALLLFALACREDKAPSPDGCALDAAVVPACGVRVGGVEVRLGEPLPEALATPEWRELGPAGRRFWFEELGVGGFADGDEVVVIDVSGAFGGATGGGVAVGSSEEAVRDALGEGRIDSWTGAWHYAGIAIEWEGGVVRRMQVFGGG